MMKRFWPSILIVLMVVSIISIPLEVSATEALIISADTQYAGAGETVTITLSASNNPGLSFLQVTLKYDTSALTLESATNGNVFSTFEKGVNLQWSSDEDTINNGTLATLIFKVNETAFGGSYAINPTFREAYDSDINDIAVIVNPGTIIVTSELKGAQAVSVTAPVKGAVPQSTIADGTGFTGTITWEGNPTKFAANTVYTANITLTAADYYVFASDATGSVSGATVSNNSVSSDGRILTFRATFPKTADKEAPVCVAPANVTATYGQKLSDIVLRNPDGNTAGTWTWANPNTSVGDAGTRTFKATFTPTNTNDYATVENIDVTVTVNPKPITVTITDIADQQYTGSQIKPAVTVTGDNKTLVLNTDYTVEYGANKNVGADSGSVTVKAKGGSNYTFSDTTKNFNIVAQAGQVSISGDLNVTYPNIIPDVTINKHGSDGDVTVYYYTNDACTEGKSTTKPTNAGNYWAKAEMSAGTNYGSAISNVIAFTIKRASITPWVNITGWTYGDIANEPVVNGNTGNGNVKIEYKLKNADDNSYSTTAPTNAGTYTIRAAIAETTNYVAAVTSMDFVISPKDISNVTIGNISNQTYSGNAILPRPVVMDGSKELIPNTDFTYDYENNINVGTTAIVKVIGKGNYSGSASKEFTIVRADLSITVDIIGWTVGGNPNKPTVSGNLGNGTVTYQYKVKGANDDTYSPTVPTAIGNYTVKATVAQTANYNEATATADFVISEKAVQKITAEDITVTYGDLNKKVFGTTNGNGIITYTVKSGEDVIAVDSRTGALSIKRVGTATVTVAASETASHSADEKDITVTVEPKKITAPVGDTTVYTYNGREQIYNIAENDAYTVIGNKQTAANEAGYTVTVSLKDTVNYCWSDNSTDNKIYTFTIKKATITIAAKNKSAYVNDAIPQLTNSGYVISGLAENEALKTLPTIAYEKTPTMSREGTVKILVSGAEAPDNGNYNDIVYKNGILTITKKPSGNVTNSPTYYKITVNDTNGGSVTASKNSAKANSTITLTITADEGYTFASVKVVTRSGKEVMVNTADNKYTFKMPASKVSVTAVFNKIDAPVTPVTPETPVVPDPIVPDKTGTAFDDVEKDTYYYDAVEWAVTNGITTGTSANTFSPDMVCTRAQAIVFLWRAAGSPDSKITKVSFDDVAADSYYYNAMLWAIDNGITNGTSTTTFSPDAECTRAQIVTFLWRAQKSPTSKKTVPFTDVANDAYYVDAVAWAVEEKITTGTSATAFSPDADCTRAQIVTFLWRALID